MSRPPLASPRYPQPWSPRRPSPLGSQPPLAPHMAFASPTFPPTPDRYLAPKGPTDMQMRFPPEARRPPLAGSMQRSNSRSRTPAPLNLSSQLHPPNSQQVRYQQQQERMEQSTNATNERKDRRRSLLSQQQQQYLAEQQRLEEQRKVQKQQQQQKQPSATVDMRVHPSPTLSSTSSLSLYSGDSAKKASLADDDEEAEGQAGERDKATSTFCACLNFKALFGGGSKAQKAKEERILGPPQRRRQSQLVDPAQPNPSNASRRRLSQVNT